MNTQQAYLEGFVKRASEYGLSREEALDLLKQSAMMGAPMAAPAVMAKKPVKPMPPKRPVIGAGDLNDRVRQPGARGPGLPTGSVE